MEIENLPPLREVIAVHGLSAQKALGQNFLLDQNITDKIVREAGDVTGRTVFEIGPGPGGLTRSILRAGAEKVIAIEFDPRAVAALEDLKNAAEERLEIIQGDALDIDLLEQAAEKNMIIANLPYNIATPLLIKWLQQIREVQSAYESITIMVQKEVGERMMSAPNSKTYGRLSVLCQWLCDVRRLFDVSPAAFTPPPKVISSVMHLRPKDISEDAPNFKAVEEITAAAFGQRRKMIRSSMKDYTAALEACDIDLQKRAENLSVEDYIRLVTTAHP